MSARTDAGINVWVPWRHIGRGAGDLTIGRVSFGVYTGQRFRLHFRRSNRAVSVWAGPILVIARRRR